VEGGASGEDGASSITSLGGRPSSWRSSVVRPDIVRRAFVVQVSVFLVLVLVPNSLFYDLIGRQAQLVAQLSGQTCMHICVCVCVCVRKGQFFLLSTLMVDLVCGAARRS